MSRIKSALELALEKTENMTIDKEAIAHKAFKSDGRKLAQSFMESPETVNLPQAIKKFPGGNAAAIREGVVEVLLSYIKLPSTDELPEKLKNAGKGFVALKSGLFGDKEILEMFQQLEGFLKQYSGDIKNLEENLRKQFAPKLKQKEQELAARTGRAVHIEPLQDPEFVSFYNKNMTALRTQYQEALDKAKGELADMVK